MREYKLVQTDKLQVGPRNLLNHWKYNVCTKYQLEHLESKNSIWTKISAWSGKKKTLEEDTWNTLSRRMHIYYSDSLNWWTQMFASTMRSDINIRWFEIVLTGARWQSASSVIALRVPSLQRISKSSDLRPDAHESRLFPSVFSKTVSFLIKATSASVSTKHLRKQNHNVMSGKSPDHANKIDTNQAHFLSILINNI